MKIECKQATKRFGRRTEAVKDVSLTLDQPSITGLVGRNGAGKTTLLQLMAGYLKPTEGKVLIGGEAPFNHEALAANVSLIDDRMAFPEGLSLGMVMKLAEKMYPNWNKVIGDGLFAYFGFDHKARHEDLSKGKKSLFNAVFGLAARTDVTFFDEPTTGMDEETRRDFYRALLKDYLEEPRIILVSSHHIGELEDLLESVIVMEEGRIFLHEDMADLDDYAFSVTGSNEAVTAAVAGKHVLDEEAVGPNLKRVLLKRDMTTIPEPFTDAGFKVGRVSATEVCHALTKSRKGAIDDVYSRQH
ncbi:ATP-binding cassette domain-containing protein [Salisediminibacterium selenitireducens]|uniref:ABC transporter related protein n=1 Tax=Bacillus selenitireducens (strain ATCC 700615 / DSM 15326 / MLS10) TaxID=439292 RepID=D6XXF3_BACIE|nr:ABC transporter ATP-binding protein [Salisediminibacterium selenitireducens]ADH98010.1 ABC transporter related protein [[Bacillus] selenitireducens MLS10]